MKKSDVERARLGFKMADVGQRMVKEQFKQRYPHWPHGELKAAVFERIYRDDFPAEEMARIKAAFLMFHQK